MAEPGLGRWAVNVLIPAGYLGAESVGTPMVSGVRFLSVVRTEIVRRSPMVPRVHEVQVRGCASAREALAWQEPIALLLCPEPEHRGPCEVPWTFTVRDVNGEECLIAAIIATAPVAERITERVRALTGHEVVLVEGDPADFEVLVEQYRVERGALPGS